MTASRFGNEPKAPQAPGLGLAPAGTAGGVEGVPLTAARGRVLPQAVRIIGGQWKRSKLPVIESPGLRPTPSRVRETLFNWLGQDLTGWRCLDAFAGSGALGFEAASRHAALVVLLERDRRLAAALRQCRDRLQATAVRVENVDAIAWMSASTPASFDLVLLDPPFGAGLTLPALERAARLLAAGGLVYLESGQPIDAQLLAGVGWRATRRAQAGQVHYALLERAAVAPPPVSDKLAYQ